MEREWYEILGFTFLVGVLLPAIGAFLMREIRLYMESDLPATWITPMGFLETLGYLGVIVIEITVWIFLICGIGITLIVALSYMIN